MKKVNKIFITISSSFAKEMKMLMCIFVRLVTDGSMKGDGIALALILFLSIRIAHNSWYSSTAFPIKTDCIWII